MTKRSPQSIAVLHHFIVHPRLSAASIVTFLVYFLLLPEHWRPVTKFLAAWDSGMLLYLILASVMMLNSNSTTIRSRAVLQDEGKFVILGLTVFSTIASLAAIVAELVGAKGHGGTSLQHVIFTGATIMLAWLFMQTMFALHYAHEFYNSHSRSKDGGLAFPGQILDLPDYWDFIYFSFIIGTAAQTADVNLTSKTFRRLVTFHCVFAFFFNTTILALTVNVCASLL